MLVLITGGSSCGKSAFAEKLAVSMREKFGDLTTPQMIYIATMEPFSEDAAEKIQHHHQLRAGKGFVTLEHYRDIGKAVPKLAYYVNTGNELPKRDDSSIRGCEDQKQDFSIARECEDQKQDFSITRGCGDQESDPFMDVGAENSVREFSSDTEDEREKPDDRAGRKRPVILLECLSNLLANEMFAPHVTEEMRAQPAFDNSLCTKICAGLRELEKAAACLILVSCNVGEDGASYAWETVKYIHILEKLQAELAKEAGQVYEVVCGIPVVLKKTD